MEFKWGVLLYYGYWGLFILHTDIPVQKSVGETSFTGMPGPIFAVPSQWHKATTRAAPSCCWGCSPPGTKHRGLWTDEPVFQGTTWSLWFCNVLTSHTTHTQWHLYWEDHDETWPNLEFLNWKTHTVPPCCSERSCRWSSACCTRHLHQWAFWLGESKHVQTRAACSPHSPACAKVWENMPTNHHHLKQFGEKTSCQIRFVNILRASGCWKKQDISPRRNSIFSIEFSQLPPQNIPETKPLMGWWFNASPGIRYGWPHPQDSTITPQITRALVSE